MLPGTHGAGFLRASDYNIVITDRSIVKPVKPIILCVTCVSVSRHLNMHCPFADSALAAASTALGPERASRTRTHSLHEARHRLLPAKSRQLLHMPKPHQKHKLKVWLEDPKRTHFLKHKDQMKHGRIVTVNFAGNGQVSRPAVQNLGSHLNSASRRIQTRAM